MEVWYSPDGLSLSLFRQSAMIAVLLSSSLARFNPVDHCSEVISPAVSTVDECIINAQICDTIGHEEVVLEASICFCVWLFYFGLQESVSDVWCTVYQSNHVSLTGLLKTKWHFSNFQVISSSTNNVFLMFMNASISTLLTDTVYAFSLLSPEENLQPHLL